MAEAEVRPFNINFGPQHPAAHGVLRLVLELDGEVVERVDPHVGLLHRGTEKLIEHKTYLQAIGYFDRLDYVAPMNQDTPSAWRPRSCSSSRCLSRPAHPRDLFQKSGALSHLFNVTTQAMDVGALTPPLWGFEEREKLMIFYERASGSRMHAKYFRIGGVHQDLPRAGRGYFQVLRHPSGCARRYRGPATGNRIFKQRNVDIGKFTLEEAMAWGLSGVMLRSPAPLGPAPRTALRVLFGARVRHSDRQERRLLRPLRDAHRGDAAVHQDHEVAHVGVRALVDASCQLGHRVDKCGDDRITPSLGARRRKLQDNGVRITVGDHARQRRRTRRGLAGTRCGRSSSIAARAPLRLWPHASR